MVIGTRKNRKVFQSTHPREGVRLNQQAFTIGGFKISIHAPPRRSATLLYVRCSSDNVNFNPRTPAKECDILRRVKEEQEYNISIHAPPRRSATG